MKPTTSRRWVLTGLFALAATALSACKSVDSLHILGERYQGEKLAWFEGVWHGPGDGVVHIKPLENGTLRLAGVQWEDETFVLEEMSAEVSSVGETLYLNLQGSEPEAELRRYVFFRVSFDADGEYMMLLGMQYDTFEKAVEEGKLKGTVEHGEHSSAVHLEASSAELAAFVRPEKVGRQFEVDSPLVLRRVGKVSSEEAR